MCFIRQFLRKIWPIQLAFLRFIGRRIFRSSVTLCNTSSFLTRSVQLIFSILIQYHTSKLPRHFWCTFRSVHARSWLCHIILKLISVLLIDLCAWSKVTAIATTVESHHRYCYREIKHNGSPPSTPSLYSIAFSTDTLLYIFQSNYSCHTNVGGDNHMITTRPLGWLVWIRVDWRGIKQLVDSGRSLHFPRLFSAAWGRPVRYCFLVCIPPRIVSCQRSVTI
jgi:hypothetical protein